MTPFDHDPDPEGLNALRWLRPLRLEVKRARQAVSACLNACVESEEDPLGEDEALWLGERLDLVVYDRDEEGCGFEKAVELLWRDVLAWRAEGWPGEEA